jgi:internalin A
MPLTLLSLYGCKEVSDIKPLQGSKTLATLDLSHTRVTDLAPLKDMPLTSLHLDNCYLVRDISALKGMSLQTLGLSHCRDLRDLAPLQGMKLSGLSLVNCGYIQDLTPLREMPLTTLSLENCKGVSDVAPLKDMKLTNLRLPPQEVQGLDLLRKMPTLATIDNQPAEAFWKMRDTPK